MQNIDFSRWGSFGCYFLKLLCLSLATCAYSVSSAADEAVTGNLSVDGTVDVAGNSFTLGTASSTYAAGFLYSDTPTAKLTFHLTDSAGVWAWQRGSDIGMTLDASNKLSIPHPDGVSAGIVFDPSGNSQFGSSVLFSGSNNRAPNQTITDEASLLTVDLGDSRYVKYDNLIGDDLTGTGMSFVAVNGDGKLVRNENAVGLTATNSEHANAADYANNAGSAEIAIRAYDSDRAEIAFRAYDSDRADSAFLAIRATDADNADMAFRSTSSDYADMAFRATGADLADRATDADSADFAWNAGHADSAGSFDATADSNFNLYKILNVGQLGIGTSSPQGRLHIAGNFAGGIYSDEHDRPGIGISGTYPQIVMMAAATETQGATLMLGAYDDGDTGDNKHWSIGTPGKNARFLDIGYAENNLNPHAGIRNIDGSTFLTIINTGNVGIGEVEPTERLVVAGNVKLTGDLITSSLVGTGDAYVSVDADGRLTRSSTAPGGGGSGGSVDYATNAGFAASAGTASHASNADFAGNAGSALYAANAGAAVTASTATHADSADVADSAIVAQSVAASADSDIGGYNLNNVGHIGVGTSTPSAPLEVVGEAKITAVTISGVARFDGVVRIARQGDLDMGEFTAEPTP